MAQAQAAKTAAERQRAYRERQKKQRNAVPKVKAAPPANDPVSPEDDEDEDVSLAALNATMRRMAADALTQVGGVEYLKRVASKNASTFLRFVGQFVSRDDLANPGGFNIFVQRLVVEGAQPVRGVITSPIAGHIDVAARALPRVAEIVEEVQRAR